MGRQPGLVVVMDKLAGGFAQADLHELPKRREVLGHLGGVLLAAIEELLEDLHSHALHASGRLNNQLVSKSHQRLCCQQRRDTADSAVSSRLGRYKSLTSCSGSRVSRTSGWMARSGSSVASGVRDLRSAPSLRLPFFE